MLVLTRKPGQSITIDTGTVKIYLLQIDHNQAKIGIEAPPTVKILRTEVEDRDDQRDQP